MTKRLTPSERLIYKVIRSAAAPVHAGDILRETECSLHTLIEATFRLARLGLIQKVNAGDGPRYAPAAPEGEVRA